MLKLFLTYLFFVLFMSQASAFDMKFLRLYLNIDPAVRYIKGSATEIFTTDNSSLPLKIDLSDSLKVNFVLHGEDTVAFYRSENRLIILPDKKWSKTDSITINYEGIPQNTGLGSVCFSSHNGIPVFWTLSEPFGAKDWFPCIQDISDKIDSSFIIIKCPKKYRAVSNGNLFCETIQGKNRITEWRHKYPCAYYLLAVAVTQYKEYSDYAVIGKDTVKIINYVYPDRYEQAKKKTWRLASTFKMLCDSFGEYPFIKEKYSHAQFNWSGGMEHQTVSFIADFDLDLMIHELAHQWFGNMITGKSWRDVFLHEGFATYCECLAAEKGLSNCSDDSQWRRATILKACQLKKSSLNILDTLDIHKLFDSRNSYSKGAMILHQLRKELGDVIFFNCIREYLKDSKLRYQNAEVEDFINIVRTVSGRNLDWFFAQWFYGSGYPVYEIKWQQESETVLNIRISQQTTDSLTPFFRSKIPLMVCGENGEKVFYRLNNHLPEQDFNIPLNFYVSTIIFDPYNDVLTKDPIVKKTQFIVNKKVKKKKKRQTQTS
ncbi:MAG: M1 family metallopeptidase [Bacteroidales bacterium]|nr:M1 family metallopeptidase [Bacteroidales bacterium]